VASKVHRQETLDGLKKFNARRKLKVSTDDINSQKSLIVRPVGVISVTSYKRATTTTTENLFYYIAK